VTAALDHEAIDHTVESEAVVKTVLHILQEIGHSSWRFVWVKFKANRADAGLHFDHRVAGKYLR
jgi:transposase